MATTSKMAQKKAGPKKTVAKGKSGVALSKQERVDDAIMNTNDSSIVSKRSVCKLYMANEPDFYEPFVQKFVRRNPLINRGYWLRMHAIEQVVRRFLQEDDGKSKVVVNLGCGYDPLPFQFWHRHADLARNAMFVDVDYPPLIGRKCDRMLANQLSRDALFRTNLRPAQAPIYLRSDQYMALGCDLRDLETLEKLLRSELDAPSSSFLFVAEVSVTYMPTSDADALIRWASTLEDARFCVLEQYLPQGSDHPFAQTMLAHFNKLGTHIHAVKQYPLLSQQKSRFLDAGWPAVEIARNLWDLWSDDEFTSPMLRRSLDAVEPFDEWEEFALFAGHYFLLVASNSKFAKPSDENDAPEADAETNETNRLHLRISHRTLPTESPLIPRRFGAAVALGQDTVAFHGGQGAQARLASIDVLVRDSPEFDMVPCASTLPQARVCHTVTPVDGAVLLVGGRASPAHALADCWMMQDGLWTQVQDLSPARFRHSSCEVSFASTGSGDPDTHAVLAFGGRTSDGTVLDEWTLWTAKDGWNTIPANGPRPSARFGAAMCTIGSTQNRGVMLGGMAPSGTVLQDMWEWHVSLTPHPHLTFSDRTNDVRQQSSKAFFGRLGASLVPLGGHLLLTGGVSKQGISSLSQDFLAITYEAADPSVNIESPIIHLPQSTWPLLVGMGTVAVSPEEVIIAGGGAVCFSMGSFWNSGYLSITLGTEGLQPWSVYMSQNPSSRTTDEPSLRINGTGKGPAGKRDVRPALPQSIVIPRVAIETPEGFASLLAGCKPAIIENLDIGPCKDLWTTEYLKSKVGGDREIVIHECTSDRMTFKDKNFSYAKKPFGDFIDSISSGAQAYLRAVSSSQPNKLPTKLEDDFPFIAGDFQLPEIFNVVKDNLHSSPLRISGPVALWLHYDVLANVLCQVRGSKSLHLFPPSDVKHLSYPPGGSSSNTDVLTSRDNRLKKTHPHVAELRPGDVLFIPPMWSHTAMPEDGVSVAVNVFFRNLDNGYAAGRDVYGNRDLQAYENGRRDVERIAKAFKNIPEDMAKFYLDRLAAELQEKADSFRNVTSD